MHPERRVRLDSVDVYQIEGHPLSTKIYGKPKPSPDLLRSIEQVGLLQPIIINTTDEGGSFTILAGNNRAEAWRILHEQKGRTKWIPCRIFHLSTLEAEKYIIDSNLQRVKTPEQIAREFKELKRIEAGLAEERMLRGGPSNLTEGKGEAAELAARKLGKSKNTAKKLEAILDASDNGNPEAQEALTQLNAGNLSIDKAHRTVYKREAKDPAKLMEENSIAQDLTNKLIKRGLTGEVTRSKKEGKFHLMIRDLSPQDLDRILESIGDCVFEKV